MSAEPAKPAAKLSMLIARVRRSSRAPAWASQANIRFEPAAMTAPTRSVVHRPSRVSARPPGARRPEGQFLPHLAPVGRGGREGAGDPDDHQARHGEIGGAPVDDLGK